MGQDFNIDIKSKNIQFMNESQSMIITNKNYLSYICNDLVQIYYLNLKENNFSLNYRNSINCKYYINYINFHPNYPQLILSSLRNSEIKLLNGDWAQSPIPMSHIIFNI